jgi:Zinc carboxypeptidase
MKLRLSQVVMATLMVSFTLAAAPPTGRYKQIVDQMNTLQTQYPTLAHVYSIGQNDDGVDIFALRISTTPNELDPKKVGHILVGTHHGNESAAATFVMRFSQRLLTRYGSKEIFEGNLGDLEWTVVPVLNISGYNANNRYEHGYDPNRDYPGPCTSDPGGHLKSIRMMMELMGKRIYSGSVTVHGYIGVLAYPWGMELTNTHTHDDNLFAQITQKAARINGYQAGISTDIIYPADGCYEDHAYLKYGMWSLLVELKDGSESDLASTVNAIETYYGELDSSPSTHNQLTGQCGHSKGDLKMD